MTAFLNGLPYAVAQGLIWGIMAIGVLITYKVLDIADLTVDGSLATGGGRGYRIYTHRMRYPAYPCRHSYPAYAVEYQLQDNEQGEYAA